VGTRSNVSLWLESFVWFSLVFIILHFWAHSIQWYNFEYVTFLINSVSPDSPVFATITFACRHYYFARVRSQKRRERNDDILKRSFWPTTFSFFLNSFVQKPYSNRHRRNVVVQVLYINQCSTYLQHNINSPLSKEPRADGAL
jgi:hypothetical protein